MTLPQIFFYGIGLFLLVIIIITEFKKYKGSVIPNWLKEIDKAFDLLLDVILIIGAMFGFLFALTIVDESTKSDFLFINVMSYIILLLFLALIKKPVVNFRQYLQEKNKNG